MERFLRVQQERLDNRTTSEETVIPSTFFTGQRRWVEEHNWYYLRISFVVITQERFDELLRDWMADPTTHTQSESDGGSALVMSYEKGSKKERPHVHMLGQYLDQFHAYIQSVHPDFKGNANFSFGRRHWDSQWQFENTIKYIVKDGNYKYTVFKGEWIDKIAAISFKKTQGGKFNDELEKIRILYITKKISDVDVFFHIFCLKAEYNQSINEKQIKDRVTSWKCKRDSNFARSLAIAYSETYNFA